MAKLRVFRTIWQAICAPIQLFTQKEIFTFIVCTAIITAIVTVFGVEGHAQKVVNFLGYPVFIALSFTLLPQLMKDAAHAKPMNPQMSRQLLWYWFFNLFILPLLAVLIVISLFAGGGVLVVKAMSADKQTFRTIVILGLLMASLAAAVIYTRLLPGLAHIAAGEKKKISHVWQTLSGNYMRFLVVWFAQPILFAAIIFVSCMVPLILLGIASYLITGDIPTLETLTIAPIGLFITTIGVVWSIIAQLWVISRTGLLAESDEENISINP